MSTKSIFLTTVSLQNNSCVTAQKQFIMQSINHYAPVKCSRSMLINATPSKVWGVLTNISDWAKWQTEISSPSLKGALKEGTGFIWKTGGAKINSTLHTVIPNKSFGWTGKTFGMKAIHNWTITEEGGQTKVAVEESMEGLLAILLKKSFNKNLAKGMGHWLELLKTEAEK